MFDFHEKRKIKSFLYSKVVITVLFLCALYMAVTVYDRYIVARDMHAKLEAKKSELTELQLRAEALESKVEYLEDERGVEEELRNRFDVAKEGEQVIILIDPKKSETEGVRSAFREVSSSTKSKESPFELFKFW